MSSRKTTKKKIIFINNHFQRSDGTVRVLINLCNNLDPKKYDITIASVYRFDKSLCGELRKDIHTKTLFGFYFKGMCRIVRMLPASFLHRVLVGDNFDVEVAFQCDVPTKIVGYKKNNKKQIAWMHGYGVDEKYYKNMDTVVCVTEENRDRCIAEMPCLKNVRALHSIQDDKRIIYLSQSEACSKWGRGVKLVTVGRLSPEKGFVRLVKVLGELKDDGYDFYLKIIGDGDQYGAIKAQIIESQIDDRVELCGFKENPYPEMVSADIFICSSFSEAYQTASTESAVLGVPIISTCVSGAKEILSMYKAGAVCGLEDDELKEAMRGVLCNPARIERWKAIALNNKKYFNRRAGASRANRLMDEIIFGR